MASNTDLADINEIMLGYYIVNSWQKFDDSLEAKAQIKAKTQRVGQEEADIQTERALVMAKESLKWAKANGYRSMPKKVWWTARPGILANAVNRDVDSAKNPTDILVQFMDGNFLGLSAKSTKTQGDIGFKNPGVGTVEKNLGIKLAKYDDEAVKKLLSVYDFSSSKSVRKNQIRSSDTAKALSEELGTKVLNQIRDELFKKLNSMTQNALKNYILDDWMDAKEVYPPYIKVTGMRVGAKIEDPLKNNKISALNENTIKVSKVGNDSVGVMAGNYKILKMRSKYESQKLASSLKFSGDPWKN